MALLYGRHIILHRRRFIVFTFLFFFLQRNGHVTRLRTSYSNGIVTRLPEGLPHAKSKVTNWIANDNEIRRLSGWKLLTGVT
jgi:hypothetical protein